MNLCLRSLFAYGGTIACFGLSSCAPNTTLQRAHVQFTEREDYPKTSHYWKDAELYESVSADDTHIKISTAKQRGYLMYGELIIIDYPICSGRKTHPTPTGSFKITEKKREKSSNRYGRIYDAEGMLVNGDADIRKDEVPEGGKFVGAPMPCWMRLNNDGIGHHIGPTLRRPVSHGCIRGPVKVMPMVYARVKMGSDVVIDQ